MVAVLAMAAPMAVSVSRLAVALRVATMLLDLSLCQQASGLSPTRTSLVLLVLPIELSRDPQCRYIYPLKQNKSKVEIVYLAFSFANVKE